VNKGKGVLGRDLFFNKKNALLLTAPEGRIILMSGLGFCTSKNEIRTAGGERNARGHKSPLYRDCQVQVK
jgi:hypothetical protein